jgi:hypothetical protein
MIMSDLIVVNPTIVDEIEFYISEDGKYTGMSQRGLARLCGVSHTTIQKLFDCFGLATWQAPESLKALPNKSEWVATKSPNGAEVIPSNVCAGIIAYYAYESKVANPTAKYSFQKFAQVGIDSWIKQVTGYAKESRDDKILDCLQKLMYDMDELKAKTQAYDNIKGTTVKVFPGLNKMLTDMEVEDEFLELEPDVTEMTAAEWLKFKKGIALDSTQKRRFSLLLSETYKATVGKEPKKVNRVKDGKKNNGVFVYHYTEWAILQLCLNKILYTEV